MLAVVHHGIQRSRALTFRITHGPEILQLLNRFSSLVRRDKFRDFLLDSFDRFLTFDRAWFVRSRDFDFGCFRWWS